MGFVTGKSPVPMTAAAVVVAASIFLVDAVLPLGVAGGVPYVALVLMGVWFPRAGHTYVLAAAGSVLTVAGYFASPEGGTFWVVMTNRALALFAIWITAFLIASRKRFENQLLLARATLEDEVAKRVDQLMASETRFRAVTQSAQDAIITVDRAGRIVQWNHGAQSLFGYDDADIVGKPVTTLIPERYRDAHAAGFERVMAGGERRLLAPVEVEVVGGDGVEFPVELTISAWNSGDQRYVSSIMRDIRERRRAEAELHKLSQTVEQNPNLIFITDTNGVIEYANDMFYEITGYSPEEVIGKNPGIIKSGRTPVSVYESLWTTLL
ncbi:MAG: PAS domain S-box protein, partial [Alphaproteobacteria bacterium]|nr:PAS domain S-box protein [Alphaproteobacteria bacterium]